MGKIPIYTIYNMVYTLKNYIYHMYTYGINPVYTGYILYPKIIKNVLFTIPNNELQIEPEFIVNDELDKDHLQIFKNIKKNAETQYAMQNKSKNRFGQPV